MSEAIKILWSGLTGRTGRQALRISRERDDVKIVAGVSRAPMYNFVAINDLSIKGIKWFQYDELTFPFNRLRDIDVIVDFSHPQQLGPILTLAVMLNKPLVIGTSGLTLIQLEDLRHYTYAIPIFRGGNFYFKVKKFIDGAVELAQTQSGNLTLYENFYKGKAIPSEVSEVIKQRIFDVTGKKIGVYSAATFGKNGLICDWKICPKAAPERALHCRTYGPENLAPDVLEICKVMAHKPTQNGRFYDLDEIWEDIPQEVRPLYIS